MSTNGRTSEEETEITRVKSEIEQLRDQNASHKHECKELKQMIKNHNVVLKEFSKSYETQKSSFETLEAELMALKEQLAIRQKDYDQKAAKLQMLREVLDTKQQDVTTYETRVKDLKEKMKQNTLKLNTLNTAYEEKQYKEWFKLLEELKNNNKSLTRSLIIKNKVEECFARLDGIPDSCRGQVWQLMSPFYALKAKEETPDQLYYKMLEIPSKWEKVIEKDIHRTFPNHEFYSRMKDGNKLNELFNVLKAYSNYDASLGYCQGMNFLVAMLLMYMDQEGAFWMLLTVMQHYRMVGLYEKGPMLPWFLSHFDNEIRIMSPQLHAHLKSERINPVMYCTEWFTTMFIYCLPIETVARIWDIFFYGDGAQVLFRVALALMKIYQETIMQRGMEEILSILKKKIRHVSPSLLIATAQKIQLTSSTIDFLKAIEVTWQVDPNGTKKLTTYVRGPDGTIYT